MQSLHGFSSCSLAMGKGRRVKTSRPVRKETVGYAHEGIQGEKENVKAIFQYLKGSYKKATLESLPTQTIP